MRLLVFLITCSIWSLFSQPIYAQDLSPELNAHFRSGNDGRSVTLSTSIRLPQVHFGQSNDGYNKLTPYKIGPFYWTSKPSVYARDDRGILTQIFTNMPCNPQSFIGQDQSYALDDERSGDGIIYQGKKVNRSSGEVVLTQLYCKANQVSPSAPPSSVSLPPSYGEIWNSLYSQAFDDQSANSGVYVAPASPGLVRLPTYMWAEFENSQSITRNVNFSGGYSLNAQAYISSIEIYIVDTKGARTTLASVEPNQDGIINTGSYYHPLVKYIFNRKGDYLISIGVVWSVRNVQLSGPDIGVLEVPLGSLRLEINREYKVNELLPALVN